MRILVTGANGLIGTALVERLRREDCAVSTTSRRPMEGPEHRRADLEDLEQAISLFAQVTPDAVIHLAGSATGDHPHLYRANALTTLNVVQAAAALGSRPHLVIAGSAAEYGEGTGQPLEETAPLRPVSTYGQAKVAATTLAQAVAERYDLPLTIVRPFNVVSNRLPVTTALGNLRRQLLDQSTEPGVVRCGRLDVIRDFVPLDFVVEALLRLTFQSGRDTFNVCSGVGISLGAILEAMATRLDVKLEVVAVPELLAIPAPDRIVGSPERLVSQGLHIRPTAQSLAEICLGEES